METFISIGLYSVLVLFALGTLAVLFVTVANALVQETEEPEAH